MGGVAQRSLPSSASQPTPRMPETLARTSEPQKAGVTSPAVTVRHPPSRRAAADRYDPPMKPSDRPRVAALLASAALALGGCAASLTPAARAVQFSDTVTTSRCRALGEVTAIDSALGSRQRAWSGLREAAAARSATHVVLIPYAPSGGGYSVQRARAFRCGR